MSRADVLDDLAETAFGDARGRDRVAPLLTMFAEQVAALQDDDARYDLWQAIRIDWALCDAPVAGGAGVGDTWARRMVAADPEVPRWVTHTFAGLFEVWPGKTVWVRDRVGGLCAPLRDAVEVEPAPEGGPAALWETRVVLVDGAACLCRTPLPYPLEILPLLQDAHEARFRPGTPVLTLQTLRRLWLRWRRAPRLDPRVAFVSLRP